MATLDTFRYRPGGFPQPRRNTAPAAPLRRDVSAPAKRRARAIAADRAASSRVDIPRRAGIVCSIIAVGYLGLIGKLAYIQIAKHGQYVIEAREMRRKTIRLAAPRGMILARDGTVLVNNEPAVTVVVDPNLWDADLNVKKGETFEARKENALTHLERLLPGVDVRGDVEKRAGSRVRVPSGKMRFRTVDLAERVPVAVGEKIKAAIKEHAITGVGVLPDSDRKAIDGMLAPQIIGFTGQEGDGLDGLEKVLDPNLEGKNGLIIAELDKGRVPIPGTEYKRVEPRSGRDIVLTLDAALQKDVETALDRVFVSSKAEAAVAVVMDPKTGDILAMANRPTYNVNTRDPKTVGGRMNRCVSSPYEPGSTLKVMTMAAALEEKLATPNAQFFCGGSMGVGRRTIHCAHGARHGTETATDVIKNSCNIASAQLAFRLGKEKLYSYEKQFGFGAKSGAGFPGESRGIMAKADVWSDIQTANIGFGQGISVTPLQLTAAYAAIANGGTYLPPRIVLKMSDPETGEMKDVPAAKGRKVVSPETSQQMLRMLQEVVDHGTGDRARLTSWTSGGKTGTAQIAQNGRYNGKYVASFVGMAPMNDPQFVILVAVTAPKGSYYGGVVAGPVFKEIAEKALLSHRVKPDKMVIEDAHTKSLRRRKKMNAPSGGVGDVRRYAD